ncbi:unnamed protein product [Enterobius vermicularis]|uniref:TPR_REGION domain-containing protein n=1 Tax=Enterobius vermicularis TaxID=51028 RepID=A0A0N4V3Y9_ENTVE|nr:unnamed protein product [Enterobius vermicularis]
MKTLSNETEDAAAISCDQKIDNDDVVKDEESKLEKAYQLKNEANMKYNAKDYAGAIYLYHRCLLFARSVQQLSQWNLQGIAREERAKEKLKEAELSEVVDASRDPETKCDQTNGNTKFQRKRLDSTIRGDSIKQEAADLVMKCYNNLAACILNGPARREEDYLRAAEYCDKVLMQDSSNEKALFRKGSALAKANQYEQAIAILKNDLFTDRDAKELILKCQRFLNEERRRRDDEIRRNFARNREHVCFCFFTTFA